MMTTGTVLPLKLTEISNHSFIENMKSRKKPPMRIGPGADWQSIVIVLVGAIVGVGLGILIDAKIAQVPKGAFIGGLIGLAVAVIIVIGRYQNIVVHSATVKVPGVGDVKFFFTDHQRQVGWKIFTESVTRIVTQSLGTSDGRNDAALASIHRFFSRTRELLQEMPPSPKPAANNWTVELLAIKMMNGVMRPFLAKWHPIFEKHKENDRYEEPGWEYRIEFRRELENIRLKLVDHTRALGELVGVARLDEILSKTEDGANGQERHNKKHLH